MNISNENSKLILFTIFKISLLDPTINSSGEKVVKSGFVKYKTVMA